MPVIKINKSDKNLILELYKAYYTAKEVSILLGCSYTSIQNFFRGFNVLDIPKYNRLILLSDRIKEVISGKTA